jgi:hypothetical protein
VGDAYLACLRARPSCNGGQLWRGRTAASDTDTKDGGFWAEASNEEKNELVVFCRRKEGRVNPKVQSVSPSDLREEIDAYYSVAGNETDTVQEACAAAARNVVPRLTVNAGSETVHSRRAVISGTVEGADDVQVTITDEDGRSSPANVDQAGNFQAAVKLPAKGTFDFDIEAVQSYRQRRSGPNHSRV